MILKSSEPKVTKRKLEERNDIEKDLIEIRNLNFKKIKNSTAAQNFLKATGNFIAKHGLAIFISLTAAKVSQVGTTIYFDLNSSYEILSGETYKNKLAEAKRKEAGINAINKRQNEVGKVKQWWERVTGKMKDDPGKGKNELKLEKIPLDVEVAIIEAKAQLADARDYVTIAFFFLLYLGTIKSITGTYLASRTRASEQKNIVEPTNENFEKTYFAISILAEKVESLETKISDLSDRILKMDEENPPNKDDLAKLSSLADEMQSVSTEFGGLTTEIGVQVPKNISPDTK
jgi:hypothetical protein